MKTLDREQTKDTLRFLSQSFHDIAIYTRGERNKIICLMPEQFKYSLIEVYKTWFYSQFDFLDKIHKGDFVYEGIKVSFTSPTNDIYVYISDWQKYDSKVVYILNLDTFKIS